MMSYLTNMNYDMNRSKTSLAWVIEPENKIRFRYKSEGGSHGGLTGKNKENGRKSYPTVKLENYHGNKSVFIRVSLHTEDKKEHVLDFKGKKSENGMRYIEQDLLDDSTAEFANLQILSKKKDEVEKILMDQKWEECKRDMRCSRQHFEKQFKKDIKDRAKTILNSVRLYFEAFEEDKPNVPLCTLYSDIICNLKAASKGDLRIFQLSHASGSCRGGEDVILLCSKVEKDSIKVRFFEVDDNERVLWEDYGRFTPADVHYQVAIPFKTPAYPDNIKKQVYICLERNEELSEPREFVYIPEVLSKKRKLNTGQPVLEFPSESVQPLSPQSISAMSISSPGSSNGASTDMQNFSEQQSNDLNLEEIAGLCDFLPPHEQEMLNGILTTYPIDVDFEPLPFDDLLCNSLNDSDDSVESGNGGMVEVDGVPVCNYEMNQCAFSLLDMPADQGRVDGIIFEDQFNNLRISDELENDFISNVSNKNTVKESKKRKYSKTILQKKKQISSILSKTDSFGNTLLHIAVLKNKSIRKILMLNHIMDIGKINMQNFRNQTVLHLATENTDLNLVQILLEHGSNPNLQDINGDNCYHIAARRNCDDIMHEILECCKFQPHIGAFNYEGLTPLHIAIVENALDCFKLMKSYISDPNTKEKKTGKSLLHYALKFQPSFVAELLNLAEIDIDVKDFEGNTPLHIACATENTYVVKLLLEAGANPVLKNFKHKYNILENSELNTLDGQMEATTSDTEEYSENDVFEGQMPTDVTTNIKIQEMLRNAIEIREKMTESYVQDSQRPPDKRMHETMLCKLCMYLDEEMKWEKVANYFLEKEFIDSLRLSVSPTKTLLEHMKREHGPNYIKSLKVVLITEGLNDAAKLIKDCNL